MFNAMFEEMMPMMFGMESGSIPFDVLEMMMGGMEGMEGFADIDDEDEYHAMQAFLAASGMGGMSGSMSGMGATYFMDGSEDDDEDSDDEFLDYPSRSRGVHSHGYGQFLGMEFEDLLMAQMLSGGMGMDGLDIDDLARLMAGDMEGRNSGRQTGNRNKGGRGVGGRGSKEPQGSAKGPKLHSHMYKDPPSNRSRAECLADSDEEGGQGKTASVGGQKGKKRGGNKKKKVTKKKVSVPAPPRSNPNPTPQEPAVTSGSPLASTNHFSSRPRPSTAAGPPSAPTHVAKSDEDSEDEDITAEELGDLMASMLGGASGMGNGASTRANQRKGKKDKKGGAMNHSSVSPLTTAAPSRSVDSTSAKKSYPSSDNEECYFAVGDKVVVHGR